MKNVKVYNLEGKTVEEITLDPKFFGLPVSEELILQALHVQRTNARQPYAHTKTRGNVRGGGKKPWKQKGTGRARAGSSRSPLWIGGGVTFGPLSTRNYSLTINKKMKRKALLMALSDKAASDQLIFVDSLELKTAKTKEMIKALKNLKLEGKSILIGMAKKSDSIKRSAANLQKIEFTGTDSLNLEEVLKHQILLLDKASISVIEKTFKV